VDYTVVVDSQGQTVTQGAGTDMMIRVTDAAGNSFWKPVAEVRGGPEDAQADLGIELGPVVEATEGAQTVADTPEAAEAETDAEARSRRAEATAQRADDRLRLAQAREARQQQEAEARTVRQRAGAEARTAREARQQVDAEARAVRQQQADAGRERREARQAANEARRQADWEREEAEYRTEREAVEEQDAEQQADADLREAERGERDSKSVWLGPFGSFLGCAVWFWGPPLVFFPLKSILLACGYDTAALGVSIACGLTFWIGYLWFLSWQEKEERRRAVRARLDAAAGTQQGGGAEA